MDMHEDSTQSTRRLSLVFLADGKQSRGRASSLGPAAGLSSATSMPSGADAGLGAYQQQQQQQGPTLHKSQSMPAVSRDLGAAAAAVAAAAQAASEEIAALARAAGAEKLIGPTTTAAGASPFVSRGSQSMHSRLSKYSREQAWAGKYPEGSSSTRNSGDFGFSCSVAEAAAAAAAAVAAAEIQLRASASSLTSIQEGEWTPPKRQLSSSRPSVSQLGEAAAAAAGGAGGVRGRSTSAVAAGAGQNVAGTRVSSMSPRSRVGLSKCMSTGSRPGPTSSSSKPPATPPRSTTAKSPIFKTGMSTSSRTLGRDCSTSASGGAGNLSRSSSSKSIAPAPRGPGTKPERCKRSDSGSAAGATSSRSSAAAAAARKSGTDDASQAAPRREELVVTGTSISIQKLLVDAAVGAGKASSSRSSRTSSKGETLRPLSPSSAATGHPESLSAKLPPQKPLTLVRPPQHSQQQQQKGAESGRDFHALSVTVKPREDSMEPAAAAQQCAPPAPSHQNSSTLTFTLKQLSEIQRQRREAYVRAEASMLADGELSLLSSGPGPDEQYTDASSSIAEDSFISAAGGSIMSGKGGVSIGLSVGGLSPGRFKGAAAAGSQQGGRGVQEGDSLPSKQRFGPIGKGGEGGMAGSPPAAAAALARGVSGDPSLASPFKGAQQQQQISDYRHYPQQQQQQHQQYQQYQQIPRVPSCSFSEASYGDIVRQGSVQPEALMQQQQQDQRGGGADAESTASGPSGVDGLGLKVLCKRPGPSTLGYEYGRPSVTQSTTSGAVLTPNYMALAFSPEWREGMGGRGLGPSVGGAGSQGGREESEGGWSPMLLPLPPRSEGRPDVLDSMAPASVAGAVSVSAAAAGGSSGAAEQASSLKAAAVAAAGEAWAEQHTAAAAAIPTALAEGSEAGLSYVSLGSEAWTPEPSHLEHMQSSTQGTSEVAPVATAEAAAAAVAEGAGMDFLPALQRASAAGTAAAAATADGVGPAAWPLSYASSEEEDDVSCEPMATAREELLGNAQGGFTNAECLAVPAAAIAAAADAPAASDGIYSRSNREEQGEMASLGENDSVQLEGSRGPASAGASGIVDGARDSRCSSRGSEGSVRESWESSGGKDAAEYDRRSEGSWDGDNRPGASWYGESSTAGVDSDGVAADEQEEGEGEQQEREEAGSIAGSEGCNTAASAERSLAVEAWESFMREEQGGDDFDEAAELYDGGDDSSLRESTSAGSVELPAIDRGLSAELPNVGMGLSRESSACVWSSQPAWSDGHAAAGVDTAAASNDGYGGSDAADLGASGESSGMDAANVALLEEESSGVEVAEECLEAGGILSNFSRGSSLEDKLNVLSSRDRISGCFSGDGWENQESPPPAAAESSAGLNDGGGSNFQVESDRAFVPDAEPSEGSSLGEEVVTSGFDADAADVDCGSLSASSNGGSGIRAGLEAAGKVESSFASRGCWEGPSESSLMIWDGGDELATAAGADEGLSSRTTWEELREVLAEGGVGRDQEAEAVLAKNAAHESSGRTSREPSAAGDGCLGFHKRTEPSAEQEAVSREGWKAQSPAAIQIADGDEGGEVMGAAGIAETGDSNSSRRSSHQGQMAAAGCSSRKSSMDAGADEAPYTSGSSSSQVGVAPASCSSRRGSAQADAEVDTLQHTGRRRSRVEVSQLPLPSGRESSGAEQAATAAYKSRRSSTNDAADREMCSTRSSSGVIAAQGASLSSRSSIDEGRRVLDVGADFSQSFLAPEKVAAAAGEGAAVVDMQAVVMPEAEDGSMPATISRSTSKGASSGHCSSEYLSGVVSPVANGGSSNQLQEEEVPAPWGADRASHGEEADSPPGLGKSYSSDAVGVESPMFEQFKQLSTSSLGMTATAAPWDDGEEEMVGGQSKTAGGVSIESSRSSLGRAMQGAEIGSLPREVSSAGSTVAARDAMGWEVGTIEQAAQGDSSKAGPGDIGAAPAVSRQSSRGLVCLGNAQVGGSDVSKCSWEAPTSAGAAATTAAATLNAEHPGELVAVTVSNYTSRSSSRGRVSRASSAAGNTAVPMAMGGVIQMTGPNPDNSAAAPGAAAEALAAAGKLLSIDALQPQGSVGAAARCPSEPSFGSAGPASHTSSVERSELQQYQLPDPTLACSEGLSASTGTSLQSQGSRFSHDAEENKCLYEDNNEEGAGGSEWEGGGGEGATAGEEAEEGRLVYGEGNGEGEGTDSAADGSEVELYAGGGGGLDEAGGELAGVEEVEQTSRVEEGQIPLGPEVSQQEEQQQQQLSQDHTQASIGSEMGAAVSVATTRSGSHSSSRWSEHRGSSGLQDLPLKQLTEVSTQARHVAVIVQVYSEIL